MFNLEKGRIEGELPEPSRASRGSRRGTGDKAWKDRMMGNDFIYMYKYKPVVLLDPH